MRFRRPLDVLDTNTHARPVVYYDQTHQRALRARSNFKKPVTVPLPPPPPPKALQPYEMFLVLDVEATCHQGTSFDFPNEIIEFPVCLLQWKDRAENGHASQLEVVGEFRSFVRPTWRPTLSKFCKDLTGITQDQVDTAPTFPEVIAQLHEFLIKHGLIDEKTGERRVRFCWCSDGPFDIRDFVVKQCFISNIPIPHWLQGDVLDVRLAVNYWLGVQALQRPEAGPRDFPRRRSLNIPSQLEVLGLPVFEGRQHCGIDDTRNLSKIVTELARRNVCLLPNTAIEPYRRWQWMGKRGQILEEYCTLQVFR